MAKKTLLIGMIVWVAYWAYGKDPVGHMRAFKAYSTQSGQFMPDE